VAPHLLLHCHLTVCLWWSLVRCQSRRWQINPCCWYLCCQTTAPVTRTSTTLTDRHSSPVQIHKVHNICTNKGEYAVAPHFHQLCMYVYMNSEMFIATIYYKHRISYPTILWVQHFLRALVLAFLPYFIRYHVHVFCLLLRRHWHKWQILWNFIWASYL